MFKEQSPKKYVLDSCIGRRCYENPAYFDMLKIKVDDLSAATTVFTTVSEYEINKRAEYGFDHMHSQLESSFGSKISIEQITFDMKQLGIWLCDNIEGLHFPDDQILAYAMITDSVLVTCDKGLENAAVCVGHDVINPDRQIVNWTKTKTKTDFSKIAQNKVNQFKHKIDIPVQTIQKIPNQRIKKSIRKIVWSTFV